MKNKCFICMLCAISLLFCACTVSVPDDDIKAVYDLPSCASAPYNGGYCVVDGKQIKQYSLAGSLQSILFESNDTLFDIATHQHELIAVGENGVLVYSIDGKTFLTRTVTKDVDLLSITNHHDGYCVSSSDGTLFNLTVRDDISYATIPTQLNEPIIALSYGNDTLVGVAKSGKILTIDASNEQTVRPITDFYDGDFSLTDVAFSGKAHWILGQDQSLGIINVFISDNGTIWNRRIVNYLEGKMHRFDPPLIGNSICWDGQQALIACNFGRLLTLPDCMQCNTVTTYDCENLLNVISDGNSVFLLGTDGFSKVQQTNASAAENLDIETARRYLDNGAVIIDVRSREEFGKASIPNSINIPYSELKQTISVQYPDRDQYLLFTCSVGVRSASAVTMLSELGYTNVYSIGPYTNWCQ